MVKKRAGNINFIKFLTTPFILVSLMVSVYFIGVKTSFFGRADLKNPDRLANITVDFGTSYPFVRNWRFFAQGGESPLDTLETVTSQIRKLEPAYIRIDHIYDFYEVVTRDKNGDLEFDFSRLDRELNAIRAMGAKPFIALSYMPPAISKGSEVDLPVNWQEWQLVVQKTVEHISGKNGLGVRDVYYEVWNEPDLFGKFTIGGAKNYLDLYGYAARGAALAEDTHSFKFGGPGMTNLMKNWFTALIEYAGSSNLRLDFLSWHRYSKDVFDFEKDVQNAEMWITAYPRFAKAEFIISEAGINSEIDMAYDGAVSAIHTMQIAQSLSGSKAKVFNFEIKDGKGPTKYWGRWGILTNEIFGTPEEKPRYHAFTFLNLMTGERSEVYGQGLWVRALATSEPKTKTYKLLLANYDKYGNHQENVPVTLNNLPGNSFTLKHIDFLGEATSKNVDVVGNSWKTTLFMSPNTAVILELSDFSN